MKYISLKTPGSNKYWEIKSKSTCRNIVWLEKRKKARKHAQLYGRQDKYYDFFGSGDFSKTASLIKDKCLKGLIQE
jgi:hypothetical protein